MSRLLQNWWVEDVDDGRHVRTSRIVKAEGRLVTTNSGSVYELGDPLPNYVDWCRENGRAIDQAQPIKMLGDEA